MAARIEDHEMEVEPTSPPQVIAESVTVSEPSLATGKPADKSTEHVASSTDVDIDVDNAPTSSVPAALSESKREAATEPFYVRYYSGHSGRFGHEFLGNVELHRPFRAHPEFDFRLMNDGRSAIVRYANNSNYRNDSLIRKEMHVSTIVIDEIKRIIKTSNIIKEDDADWPQRNKDGRQELEIRLGNDHIAFETAKIGALIDINESNDPDGLRVFYYLVQDLKALVFSLISLHFKIKPI